METNTSSNDADVFLPQNVTKFRMVVVNLIGQHKIYVVTSFITSRWKSNLVHRGYGQFLFNWSGRKPEGLLFCVSVTEDLPASQRLVIVRNEVSGGRSSGRE